MGKIVIVAFSVILLGTLLGLGSGNASSWAWIVLVISIVGLVFTMEDVEAFYQDMISRKLCWSVEFEGRCIGLARLTVDETDHRARYATGIFDPSLWGSGLGTEMTQLVLQYAFETLKLHRVDLQFAAA
ncbi:GNAT family N-acetyltransferase [Paenibacillus mendelii]|uniref:GNAT family N-acetyltransferase n=1 Tax=Paenibacillus mendelii TaxID=206163 RepID=A0ABV6JBK5_9BACL|nr:GNAT family N-acetyltransferase [Paenibacillus mendelii]MCQ6563854.1 GNAT family N-acetyltransferase [Paenibacillus mendelii]